MFIFRFVQYYEPIATHQVKRGLGTSHAYVNYSSDDSCLPDVYSM